MAIRHMRRGQRKLNSHAKTWFKNGFMRNGKGFLFAGITRTVELLMVIFTLFWAIEANAYAASTAAAASQAEIQTQLDQSMAQLDDSQFREPASRSSRSSTKLFKMLIPKSWVQLLPNTSIPSPNLGVSKMFNDYVVEKVNFANKMKPTGTAVYSSAVSPTLKQDPLYVPTGMVLFHFRTN